jgi:U2 small nuclear ribonucleoprotein A'
MVRMTTELVAKAPSYINPVKDRELDLRGNRIPQIENLAVSKVNIPPLEHVC